MITTNTGAKKLESSDNWREIFPNPGTSAAGAHNASVDAHDRIQAEVAPIINGKRCSLGAASGEYVLLRNSTITGKTDGAYQATKAIPANTDLDSTYLGSPITGGLVNELNSNLINLDTDCKSVPEVSATKASGISTMLGLIKRNAFIVNGILGIDIPSDKLTANSELAVLNMTVRTSLDVRIVAQNLNTRSVGSFRIYSNNGIPTLTVDNNIALPDAGYYFISFTFLYY